MKRNSSLLCGVPLFLFCLTAAAKAGWTAYNDSAWQNGQELPENTTTIGIGRSFAGQGTAGNLLNALTGADTGVTATYSETFSTGSVNNAGDQASYPPDSDAAAEFEGHADLSGNISYGDSPGWYVDLTFTGLNPDEVYTFTGTADRHGGAGYAERVTNWKILGADSAVYASSAGAHKVGEDSVEFSTGDNTAGLVARWTEIRPGADGTFVIRTSHTVGQAAGGMPGAHAYKGYAGGIFSLKAGPWSWVAVNDTAWQPSQTNAPNVSTFGLGRSFAGEATTGELRNLDSGNGTGVTAAFAEHISTGSVNSANDAAAYPSGSEAEAFFGGLADLTGNISYGDSPGWYVDLTLSGLDPARGYTFVGTADRHGGPAYADRVTNWRLMGADSATYASSAGAHKVGEDSVEFSTGENTNGLVARWTDIRPGADGTIVIRTSHSVGQANGGIPGAHDYKGYAGGVFLFAEQYSTQSGPAEKPVEFTSLFPADNAMEVSPSAPIVAVLTSGDHAVLPASVSLKLDGTAVAPVLSASDTGLTVSYTSPTAFASTSSHTVELAFTDDTPAATSYSRTWSFTVVDSSFFPVITPGLGEVFDPSRYVSRGFALRIAAPDPADSIFLSSLFDAEAIWTETFTNLADPAIFNSLGYYIEPATVNYQIDGNPVGNAAGDRRFPGIAGSGQNGEIFALETTALLHLRKGHYHMNVTMRPDFKLVVGTPGNELELPVTFSQCTNCGGDDAPWFTDFMVEETGLYPFRLLYYTTGGGASLEWLEVTPGGARYLVNDPNPAAIAAYLPLDSFVAAPGIEISQEGAQTVIRWTGEGRLQSSPDLKAGTWQDVAGATSPYRFTPSGKRFYRLAK